MSGHPPTACSECHATFTTRRVKDSHRAGTWGDSAFPRRCRTEQEMLAGGMWVTSHGVWHGEWTAEKVGSAWQGRASGTPGGAA